MKRKDADEVNNDFFDFTLSSPALKIRRLDAELAPIIEEQEAMNSVEQLMESSPIAIDELRNNAPVNEERAIVLFNPNNNTPSLHSPIPFSISTDSDFLSRFINPVIWSNGSDTHKSLADETQKQDDESGMMNGCLAVVPWVPNNSHTSGMIDSDAMDVEDDYNTQQMPNWNQWQQHCMIQQPPNNLSTPISWLG